MMSQRPKENLRQQFLKLGEVREWMRDRLCEEGDRPTRDALFLASWAIGLALLHLEKVSYKTQTDRVTDNMYNSER